MKLKLLHRDDMVVGKKRFNELLKIEKSKKSYDTMIKDNALMVQKKALEKKYKKVLGTFFLNKKDGVIFRVEKIEYGSLSFWGSNNEFYFGIQYLNHDDGYDTAAFDFMDGDDYEQMSKANVIASMGMQE